MSAMPTEERWTTSPAIEALRVPPHDIGAEQSVLGGLMLAPDAISKLSDWLVEDDFYRKDHRLIYRAISELQRRGTPCDAITFGDWFDSNGISDLIGGPAYLVDLANSTPSAANIVAYAEIVVEKSRLRSTIDAGTRLTEAAWARGADSQQIIAAGARELAQLQASKLRGELEPVSVGMGRLLSRMTERRNEGPSLLGLPWPWQELNARTKGLRDGALYVVGARPNMGKSVFGLQTAVSLALAGQRIAYFSVEMTADECMSRAVACVGEIPHEWVEDPAQGDIDADQWWSQVDHHSRMIMNSPLLIDETPAINIDQLMARARRMHMKAPLRGIVVDHIHDMSLDPSREVRHEYGRITQGGKTLAKEFNCPVIMLAQLNRAAATRNDKRPTVTDLRESGEIEQKADVILFLHREDYYDRETHLKNVVEVIVAKGRSIRTGGTIDLRNVFSEMRLENWEGPRPVPSVSDYKPKPKRGFSA